MERPYYTTIGLEIHAELNTQTKMFCACKNDPDNETPNSTICPVCMAHPGTLPVINKKAVESVIKVGLAIGGTIADFTEFDRKNYFYPDIPKAYQISQYKYPIVSGGELGGVKITRVHLEEDTATSSHDKGDYSLVNFNRAGVPLMELVTEPVIHDIETVGNFARELQLILRYLGVSEANMEKGQMRVEVNISVSPDPDKFGIPVEVKNINSFRAAERAALYEQARMIDLYEAGRESEIVKETRGWDENKQATFSQRRKEHAEDYRYFPDPDLPKLTLSTAFDIPSLRAGLPELPAMKRIRYGESFGIKNEDIDTFVADATLSTYFESVCALLGGNREAIKLASNYIISDLLGLQKKDATFIFPRIEQLAELMTMLLDGSVTSRGAKDLLPILYSDSGSVQALAEAKGLIQKDDPEALHKLALEAITANTQAVENYRAGKEQALMALVGHIMKASRGSAHPEKAKQMLIEVLKQ